MMPENGRRPRVANAPGPVAIAPSRVQPEEEYLSIADLSKRIPYAAQTIRNLMSLGVFKRDVHYVKPRGRVIFRWSKVQEWIEGQR